MAMFQFRSITGLVEAMGANFKWESLHDLADKWNLAVHCECGHTGVFDPQRLARWFLCNQWSCQRHRIAERLICRSCGRRGRGSQMRIGITANLPTSDPFPKSEDVWRALTERIAAAGST